jgi:cob(I)alamin adenosyltransferase
MVSQLETPKVNSSCRLTYSVEGLLQVFTSARRSFFTSVFAQALRIAGQGTPVLVVQFLKGGIGQGHEHPARLGQNLDWVRCDLLRYIDTPELEEAELAAIKQLWQYVQDVVLQEQYSLVVLDELSLAVNFGFIPLEEVLAFLEERPGFVDVILTGPQMPQALLDVADQITEIRRSHHP